MQTSEVFQEAKTLIEENSDVLRSMFHFIPEGTEVSILVDGRIPCALKPIEFGVALEERVAARPDVEVTLFPESIRRLKGKTPSTLAALASELLTLWLSGQIQFRLISSPQTFVSKGYLQVLAKAGPEIQKEVSKHIFSAASQAAMAVEVLKSTFLKKKTGSNDETHS